MTVFVTGSTGVLGKRIVDRLTDRGYEVHGLVRDEAGAATVERAGGVPQRGDVLEPETLAAAVDEDVDVLVHAATAIPDLAEATDEDWAHNDRVRLEGLRNLLGVAGDGAEQVLFPSVVWLARQPDGSAFDETAERHPGRPTESAAEAEDLLETRGETQGFDAAILRCGLFYSADGRDTRQWADQLRSRDLPLVGGGLLGRRDATLSFVHADDAAAAFVAAIESGVSGVYHVVDDQPVTGAAFYGTFAELLDAPEPRRIPGWLAKFFLGADAVDVLVSPWPTDNGKLKRDTDWEPQYPTVQEGLEQVVEELPAGDGQAHSGAVAGEPAGRA